VGKSEKKKKGWR